ncbi:MAG: histidine phosphatase family protein [Chloroflexota bacterium]
MTSLDMFIHMEAVDRKGWSGPPDDRPLTALGLKQAKRIADELGVQPVSAIFSSPALRCRQSLEPLAARVGLPVVVLPGFKDTQGYRAPGGWENPERSGGDPLGGAQSAGSAYAALREIQARVPEGRAVLCSYGDIVPALLAFLSGSYALDMPPRNNQKGATFTVAFDGERLTMSGRPPSADFPK